MASGGKKFSGNWYGGERGIKVGKSGYRKSRGDIQKTFNSGMIIDDQAVDKGMSVRENQGDKIMQDNWPLFNNIKSLLNKDTIAGKKGDEVPLELNISEPKRRRTKSHTTEDVTEKSNDVDMENQESSKNVLLAGSAMQTCPSS